MAVRFINGLSIDEFLQKRYIYKYIPIEYITDIIGKNPNQLWFSNPTSWNDPFDGLPLLGKYNINGIKNQQHPLIKCLYATCFTTGYASEAQWERYSKNGGCCVLISINTKKLLEILDKNERIFYIGKVEYVDTNLFNAFVSMQFLTTEGKNAFHSPTPWITQTPSVMDYLIRPMLFKRLPFSYENEWRIFTINEPEEENNGCSVDVPGLNEAIGKIVLPPGKNQKFADFIKNSICITDNGSKIYQSSLYKKVGKRTFEVDGFKLPKSL